MKKMCVLFAALCLAVLTGCAMAGTEDVVVYRAVSPYYLTDGIAVEPEKVAVDSSLGEIDAAVAAFNSDTDEPELQRPMPNGVDITGWELAGSELRIYVSPQYAALTGHNRTISDACIVLTFCAIDGIDSVSIYSGEILLTARLGAGDLLLSDGSGASD